VRSEEAGVGVAADAKWSRSEETGVDVLLRVPRDGLGPSAPPWPAQNTHTGLLCGYW